MKPEQKAIRVGALVLIGAVLLRLFSGISDTNFLSKVGPEITRVALFLQTGRWIPADEMALAEMTATEPENTVVQEPEYLQTAVFTEEDRALIEIRNTSGYELDIGAMLTEPLEWNLTEQAPTVLILHTHGTESYAGTKNYRSTDERLNMLAIGDRVAANLEKAGIAVIHDRAMHDAESYNGSYAHARDSLEQYLTAYPSIRLVLDLHRDSAEDAQGQQINYTVTTEKGEAAKLMLVMGTDAGGLTYPNWQKNLSLAVKLHAGLEKICAGICRPMYLRTSRFNQDLSSGALLVEVGAAGNTLAEAMLAADILCEGILQLAKGANR